jgi:intraflagellar transport protein 80
VLYEHVDKAQFEQAIRLCRFVKENTLWATLAAMSIYQRELNTVEIALAAIDEADKVQFINYVKELPSEPARNAALAVYQKRIPEAEQILLQARLFYRAIKLNIKMYKWDRALEIAVQNKTHVDTVVAYRQRFLQMYKKPETNDKFKQFAQELQVNWEEIKMKIKQDKEREAAAAQ